MILILNHVDSVHLTRLYAEIAESCGREYDVCLLSDRTHRSFAGPQPPRREFRFTIHDLIGLDFPGKQDIVMHQGGDRVVKLGNAELPVLLFFRERPSYRFYWLVEYDVRYSGSWCDFVSAFKRSDADLLGTSMTRFAECPQWSHWRTLVPASTTDAAGLIRGFFPVFRASNTALRCLTERYRAGSSGHMEALVPTTLYDAGLRLEDIGGDGEFVDPRNVNRFYRNCRGTNDLSPGTFVYRPVLPGVGREPDKLWHPVKPRLPAPFRAINKVLRACPALTAPAPRARS